MTIDPYPTGTADRNPAEPHSSLGSPVRFSERPIAGISTMGWATLIAVVAVVVLMTLSSLRGLALRENETHAQALLRALGKSLSSEVHAAPPADLKALAANDPALEPELSDVRWVDAEGRLLLRHGYLFEWIQSGPDDAPVFVAWPSEAGRTGNRSFTWRASDGLQVSEGDAWSGLERRPSGEL